METARGNGEDVESCDVVPMSSSLDDDSHKSTVAGHEQNVDGLFDSADSNITRVAPEFGSGSGQNPEFFPNPAKIRLRSKFRRSRMLLPDVKNAHK